MNTRCLPWATVKQWCYLQNRAQRDEGNNEFGLEHPFFKVPAKQLGGNVQQRAGAQTADTNLGVISIQVFVSPEVGKLQPGDQIQTKAYFCMALKHWPRVLTP